MYSRAMAIARTGEASRPVNFSGRATMKVRGGTGIQVGQVFENHDLVVEQNQMGGKGW